MEDYLKNDDDEKNKKYFMTDEEVLLGLLLQIQEQNMQSPECRL